MEEFGQLVTSQKGTLQLEYKYFIYNKVRTNKDKLQSIYWECRRRVTEDHCTVHIKTDQNGRILMFPKSEHTHENEHQGAEIRQVRSRILQQAELRPETAPSILINENVGLRLAIEFPSEVATKRAIERRRRRLIPNNPTTALDVRINEDWANTLDGDIFLLIDEVVILEEEGKQKQERVLAFSTSANLEDLAVMIFCKYFGICNSTL